MRDLSEECIVYIHHRMWKIVLVLNRSNTKLIHISTIYCCGQGPFPECYLCVDCVSISHSDAVNPWRHSGIGLQPVAS